MNGVNPFYLVRLSAIPFKELAYLSISKFKIDRLTEEDWNNLLEEHLDIIISLSKHHTLQQGLQFSSFSFLKQLEKLYTRDRSSFRKKERQTIRTTMQYLGRISTKTTPFSSFSPISLFSKEPISFQATDWYQMNIDYAKKILNTNEKIRLNPSIQIHNEYIHWQNFYNNENIQNVEENTFLSWIIDCFDQRVFTKALLIKEFTAHFSLIDEDANHFINELIDSSFFVKSIELSFQDLKQVTNKHYTHLNQNIETIQSTFYHHQLVESDFEIDHQQFDHLQSQVMELYQFLFHYHKNDHQHQIMAIWKQIDLKQNELTFFSFYKQFLEKNLEFPAKPRYKYDCTFKTIQGIVQVEYSIGQQKTPSFGALIQLFQSHSLEAVLHDFTGGYGKYYGRFLDMLPKEIYENIFENNKSSEYQLISNKSNFQTNLDMYLPLTDKEIALNESLTIHKLGTNFELKMNGISKQIKIQDFSTIHPKFKSIRYRLLNLFGFPSISKKQLLAQISESTKIIIKSGIVIPRIQYKNIVLQRKQWIISKSKLISPKLSNFEFFKQINNWKDQNELPNYCFVSSSDHTKLEASQFIDFHNPHFVALFQSILRKVTHSINIEEMLPHPSCLLRSKNESYCSEFLVQYDEQNYLSR